VISRLRPPKIPISTQLEILDQTFPMANFRMPDVNKIRPRLQGRWWRYSTSYPVVWLFLWGLGIAGSAEINDHRERHPHQADEDLGRLDGRELAPLFVACNAFRRHQI